MCTGYPLRQSNEISFVYIASKQDQTEAGYPLSLSGINLERFACNQV